MTHNNTDQYNECLLALEILSENRDLKELVKEEEKMLSDIKLENLPSYEIAFERGEAREKIRMEKILEREREKIIQKMLAVFDNNKIHEITGISLAIIKTVRDRIH